MVRGKLVDQFGDIKGAGGEPQVALQWQEAFYGLTAGDDIQIPPSSQRNQAVSKQFQVSGELTLGTPHSPGYRLNFAQMRRVKGKNSVRLTQLGFLDNNRFRLISPWLRHF